MKENVFVVTPRFAAAAAAAAAAVVVSAVVLRRPTKDYTHPYSIERIHAPVLHRKNTRTRTPSKEYTHPYSMMHRRLSTAGIEFAPHYHQLLVDIISVVRDSGRRTQITLR